MQRKDLKDKCSEHENTFDYNKYKPTNADRIRSMTDEELAKFIRASQCCSHFGEDCGFPFCHSMNGKLCTGIMASRDLKTLEWLKKEVET